MKIYSLNNGKFIKNIYSNNERNMIFYLLSWNNKINNKNYIIQLLNKKIIITNIVDEDLYTILIHEPEKNHLSGFIYTRDNNDYLCSSLDNGYIQIWDLYNKKIYKIINTNHNKKINELAHIIYWNNKYIIVADITNKSFKIIDLERNVVISNLKAHNDDVICIKKVYHPIYGESLLSAGIDKKIKLWTI